MARGLQVYCLEGNWVEDDLTAKSSREPMLELLECHDEISYIRRDVATRAEFDHYLKRWAKLDHDFGYFAFHGDHGKALFFDGGAGVSIATLGRKLAETGAARQKVLFIASCHGLAVSEKAVETLRVKSRALAVCGYTEEVDTIQAAAFELLLMHELYGNWRYVSPRLRAFAKRYDSLVQELGFVFSCDE